MFQHELPLGVGRRKFVAVRELERWLADAAAVTLANRPSHGDG